MAAPLASFPLTPARLPLFLSVWPCRAVADLVATLKSSHVYRPTEDVGGANRAVLQQVATATVALAERELGGADSRAGVVADALAVVQAVLAVEHRAIQQHLPSLWPLLWSGAGGEEAAAAPDRSVPTAVACSLVAAYAELRQLGLLLESLVAALHTEAGARGAAAQAAAGVLCSPAFLGQLSAAVAQLPSGQVASIPGLVAAGVPALVALDASSALVLVLSRLYCCCLSSMRVDLTTAPAVAGACRALLAALASPLLLLLGQAVKGSAPCIAGHMLPALLQLYSSCLRIHAQCANLHPEVRLYISLSGPRIC